MVDLPIRNKTQETLRIMIEPIAQAYDVPSKSEVIVRGSDDLTSKGIEIEVWEENFISLWVSSEAAVWLNGKKLDPLKEA